MRIKEEFERSGEFWLPSVPEESLPGTLSISDGGDIFLELDGLFNYGIEPNYEVGVPLQTSKSIKRIVGSTEKDGEVTLDECWHSPGIPSLDNTSNVISPCK